MKIMYPIAVAVAAGLLAGCNPSEPSNSNSTAPPPANTGALNSAKQSLGESAAQTKDQFVAAMNAKLKTLDQEISQLGQKANTLTGDAKTKADQALDALRAKRADVGRQLDALKQASQDTWEKVKAGFQSALADLEKTYDDAKAKLGG